MSLHDAVLLTVDPRFQGPDGCGNGGYVCGLIGAAVDETVTVRLARPVPLQVPLELVTIADGEWRLQYEGQGIALARRARLELEVPVPPDYVRALDASIHFRHFTDHPAPRCFVCGPERAPGDALRLFAARVPGTEVAAAAWLPDASLAEDGGDRVAPEFLSAALDCPGFFALRDPVPPSALLGEYTARIDRRVHVGEPCVVVGWEIAREGRKLTVGTAVFDEDGELAAVARGLWISPRN